MLAKSHEYTDPNKRKPKEMSKLYKKDKEYEKSDELIEQCYVDYCNGVSRTTIIDKLMQGQYGNKPYARSQAYKYEQAARKRLQADRAEKADEMKDLLYARYETLLNDCITLGDRFTARAILQDMAKIFLPQQPQNQTNIQVNSDNGININFGYGTNEQ